MVLSGRAPKDENGGNNTYQHWGYISENEVVSVSKFRLWPALVAYSRWTLKNVIPGHNLIRGGLGLSIVNNLAIAVEGFIADNGY